MGVCTAESKDRACHAVLNEFILELKGNIFCPQWIETRAKIANDDALEKLFNIFARVFYRLL